MLVDFWRLIWQERPPIIVMVTNLKEGNKKKCEQYWPESESDTFGPFTVTLIEQQIFGDYCIRSLQVTVSYTTFDSIFFIVRPPPLHPFSQQAKQLIEPFYT